MTKEELKQEAEEWIAKYSKEFITNPNYSPFDYAEAIYFAGAEPREKRIAELIALINAERERQEQCDDIHLKKIAELEKENARLKDGIALKDEEIGCVETDFNTFKSKAKEHIKKLLYCLKQDTNDPETNYYVCQYMDKAEQFLNSEVEEV